ncbi:MAG: hypothetical protein ACK2UM_12420 [Anaerolineales bacterium]
MFTYHKFITFIPLICLGLSACGTFEIGIENNAIPETQEETRVETQVRPTDQPTSERVEIDSQDKTPTPLPSDEQLIAEALANKLGQPADQLGISFAEITSQHAMGGVSNGYYLAFHQDDGWQIVYDGQSTPPCMDIEQYSFPVEMVPECLDEGGRLVMRTGGDDTYSQAINNLQSLECGPGSPGASPGGVEWLACNLQDALRSRNTAALLGSLEDPFIIGYWLSEGVQYSPQDFMDLLPQLYNYNDQDYIPRLSFTTDRSQFPDLPIENLEGNFGPDVNVVKVIYSQGWGPDGDQEALIYLSEDPDGSFKWHGMLYGKFDYSP